MAFDRFLIAPLNTGLESDLKSWLIPEDAFPTLQNAYIFRGRIVKRFGSKFMTTTPESSRLSVSLGNTGASPSTLSLPANTVSHTPQLAIGQMFTAGGVTFYVYQLGLNVATKSTGSPAITATIDSTAAPNTVTFTGLAPGTPVFWYPALPVMGITQYEINSVNNHPSYAFDTEFAYVFSGAGWTRSGTAVWKGNDLNFFWATNWEGSTTLAATPPVMFVTNFNATVGATPQPSATDDPIWFFDGTTWTPMTGGTAAGIYFRPNGGLIHTGPFVQTARIILPFKNRLLLLNTIENDNATGGGVGNTSSFVNRCRFSFYGSPFARNAWYEPNQFDSSGGVVNNNNLAAGADFIDATTEEAIISAEFIKDRLIVYFERSTWELVYTGNEVFPFVWQKLNTELGSQSTFSTVPFDTEVLTIGNTGVHACNGSNVARIDNKIPNEIFDNFKTGDNATLRTAGIRDYINELVYWAFVDTSISTSQKFPNQILVYNYRNGSWAVNDDVFTAFGYFEQSTDMTWASSFPITWEAFSGTWISNVAEANKRQIIAGTPEGFILILSADLNRNAASMQITDMTFNAVNTDLTIINHNLAVGDYIIIENIPNNSDPLIIALNNRIFEVIATPSANLVTINVIIVLPPLSPGYTGGGTAARVSNIQIISKRFNPYVNKDRNVYLHRIDFAVERTSTGEITVDYSPSSTALSMIEDGQVTGSIMGNNILETHPYDPALYPLEQEQILLWHPIYFQTQAQFIQIVMSFSDVQIRNPDIAFSEFEIEGMILYTQPTTARLE